MREELVICEKKYKPAEFTFGTLRKLEKMGLNPLELGDKPLSAISAYVALTANCTLTEADKLIDEHLANGGAIDEIGDTFAEAVEESGFFRTTLGKETKKPEK